MPAPSDNPPGFWQRLFGRGDAGEEPAPAAPLFQLRPVPPPEPKGPGLPAWDEILSAAPPAPDPAARPPRPTLVPDPVPPAAASPASPDAAAPAAAAGAASAAAAPAAPVAATPRPAGIVVPAAVGPATAGPATAGPAMEPDGAAKRPPTEQEQGVLVQVGTLLGAGQPEQAAALLDSALRDRPEVCDPLGRPIYLMELLRCALRLGAADAAADRAMRLRPHLAADDPAVEVLYAHNAVAAGDRAASRANWLAALARAPDLAEAKAWLAAHQISPDAGLPVIDLLGPLAAEFAARIQPPPSLADAPAAGAAVPDWSAGRLLTEVAVAVGADGTVQTVPAAEAPGARAAPQPAAAAGADTARDLALVFRHPDGLGRPSCFADVLLAAFVLHRQFLLHLRPARLYVGRQAWALPGTPTAAAQAEMVAVLFPGIRVIGDHDGALRERQVLVVDGALRNAATGTLIGSMMPQVMQWAAEARARVHAACALPAASEPPRVAGRKPRVLYLNAAPPRTLAEPVRERLFGLFAAAGYEVAGADMASLPWHRQVRLAYGADIVTGAHGPAMNAVLWAHPQTRVLEFFPEGARRYDGQLLAEAAGLAYLGLEGVTERGFVIHARERWGPPVGRANRLVWALPWSMLEQALALKQ